MEIMLKVYNILQKKNNSTLFMQFYVDDPNYNEAYNTLDSILNINDILDRDINDGYTEVIFGLKI